MLSFTLLRNRWKDITNIAGLVQCHAELLSAFNIQFMLNADGKIAVELDLFGQQRIFASRSMSRCLLSGSLSSMLSLPVCACR